MQQNALNKFWKLTLTTHVQRGLEQSAQCIGVDPFLQKGGAIFPILYIKILDLRPNRQVKMIPLNTSRSGRPALKSASGRSDLVDLGLFSLLRYFLDTFEHP